MNEEVKEIKIQEETLTESEPSIIKEFFLSSSSERELSALFGQSETELKKEFGSYKAQKIYRRLNSFIDSRDKLLGEVKTALKEALKFGFNSVTVFSNVVSIAKSVVKGAVKVRALVNYPYGEEVQKAINYQIKCAVREGADEVLIPLSVFAFRTLASEELTKLLKKSVAVARGKRVYALIDLSVLTLPEVESAIAILINSGVYGAVLSNENGVRSTERRFFILFPKRF